MNINVNFYLFSCISSMRLRTNFEKYFKFLVIMTKYFSIELSSFLSSQGILHQSTRLHTPIKWTSEKKNSTFN